MSLPRTGSQEVPQDEGNIFVRGAAHRNTIATMRTDQRSTPTIYEEVQQQVINVLNLFTNTKLS